MNEIKTTNKLPRDYNGELSLYAFPGGYRILYLTKNNDVLCGDCARESETEYQWDFNDLPYAAFIHWEGDPLYCAECNKVLESEYGEI